MYATYASPYGRQHIGYGQVIVVMGMEIEMQVGITGHHLAHELRGLGRREDAQGVGQHETAYLPPALTGR